MDIQQALALIIEGANVDDVVLEVLGRTGTSSLTTAAQRMASSAAAKKVPKVKRLAKGFKHVGSKMKVGKTSGIKRGAAALGDWWN